MIGITARRLLSWLTATLLLLIVIAGVLGTSRFAAYQLYPYPYRGLVEAEAEKAGVNPLLLAAVIRVESKFDSDTTSRKDARGLMQIVPETGKWAAERIGLEDFTTDKLYNPETNLKLGTWYLHYLLQEFDGNLMAALAAYNGGQGNVRSWLQDNDWDGTYEQLSGIPFPETRMFVIRVLDDYRVYRWLYGR